MATAGSTWPVDSQQVSTPTTGVGGIGGRGGASNAVTVTAATDLSAAGTASRGLIAQSVGGGGGNGDINVSAAISGDATTLAIVSGQGGMGGQGNRSGNVFVSQAGRVVVEGSDAIGVAAQSIGGGGGTGGVNVSGQLTGGDGLAVVGRGGSGGAGAAAGDVRLVSDGTVMIDGRAAGSPDRSQDNGARTNFAERANGILAQSVGGGGGSGGLNLSVGFAGAGSPVAISAGGSGSGGGNAGSVMVARGTNSAASIQTLGDRSSGVTAQSVGGAGGIGGAAANLVFGATGSGSRGTGGAGGAGGNGGAVLVENASGLISTRGANSPGLNAQSVGGAGGSGGDGGVVVFGSLPIGSIGASNTGGLGGGGGSSGVVRVTNAGIIETMGDGAHGLRAQSIAGGGGNGGLVSAGGGATPLPVLGGSGGAGAAAGDVTVSNSGQIGTAGANAHGIYAQSIGGSGGTAGSALAPAVGIESTLIANTRALFEAFGGSNLTASSVSRALAGNVAAISEARLIGTGGGLDVMLAGSAGTGGDGGRIEIANTGSVTTSGERAHGIFVQSIGGAVSANNASATLSASANTGRGGDITVFQTGDITTTGAGSHGLFVQTLGGGGVNGPAVPSAGGRGAGGNISVALGGSVQAMAAMPPAVNLQSAGADGAGNITLALDQRRPYRRRHSKRPAVSIGGGKDNLFTNRGLVTSLAGAAGWAMLGTTGNDSVVNAGSGVLAGSIDLGAGKNALTNTPGGVFESGAVVRLGDGNLFTNAGTLSPGGSNTVQTTTLTGNFAQTGSPTWNVDIGEAGVSDRLTVSGSAQLVAAAHRGEPSRADHDRPGRGSTRC